MSRKNYYNDFLELRQDFFEKIKSEYLVAVEIARKRINAHNIFEQNKMRSQSQRLQKELNNYSRFIIEIRNAMDLDKRIEEKTAFNEQFDEIKSENKANLLQAIAEYDGLSLMYSFWHHRNAYMQIIDEPLEHPIKALIQIERDFAKSFESLIELRKKDFLLALEMRKSSDEKIVFALEKVNTTRAKIENDLFYKFFNLMNQHPEKIFQIVAFNLQNLDNVSFAVFDERKEQGHAAITALLKHAYDGNKDSHKKEFKDLLDSFKSQGIQSHALAGALSSKFENYEHRFLYVLFYFYYEQQFLSFLSKKMTELNQPQPNTEKAESIFEKYEWLGTQKQLAELFLELEGKKWVREKKPHLIKAYFTKSNTIEQVLKPTQDSKTKERMYLGIYTPNYRPSFDTIKLNKTIEE